MPSGGGAPGGNGADSEADLSTQQARAQAPPRLSGPYGHGGWPQGHRGPPRARPQAPFGLSRTCVSGAAAGTPDGPEMRLAPETGLVRRPPARLRNRPDFIRASRGSRVHSRSFSLQVFRRDPTGDAVPGCRVGLTVTKKVGSAVERNRIKRRLREALRAPDLAALSDHDYVIVARRDALTVGFAGLVGELRRCLGDAKTGRVRKSGARRQPARAQPATAP
jgi:ribonuclease P protein component